jgi:hypothetical protein
MADGGAYEMSPKPKTTVPFVEMFSGVGSASHYLREWFHPVAAFDSDVDVRAMVSEHLPQCTMATDFASMLAAGDGEGTFLGAAKGA